MIFIIISIWSYSKIIFRFISAVLQHENDHLNGVLFTDRVEKESDLLEMEEFTSTRANEFFTPPGSYTINNYHIPINTEHIVGENRMELRKE